MHINKLLFVLDLIQSLEGKWEDLLSDVFTVELRALDQGFILLSLCPGFRFDMKQSVGRGHNRQKDPRHWEAEGK